MALIRFIETKHYARFAEFCDACRDDRVIGICHGPAGVGKTFSARRYTHWDPFEALPERMAYDFVAADELRQARAVYYCPDVLNSAGSVRRDVARLRQLLRHVSCLSEESAARRTALFGTPGKVAEPMPAVERPAWWRYENTPPTGRMDVFAEIGKDADKLDPTELIIVDEADRLKMPSLEQLRSIYDQGGIGMVLIGMPGLEKRLSRFAQVYSRVGFVQEFLPLSQNEMVDLLLQKLDLADYGLPQEALRDKEALGAIIRTTRGNFRLLSRLLMQIRRIMEINELREVSRAVVEAAREALVIGVD